MQVTRHYLYSHNNTIDIHNRVTAANEDKQTNNQEVMETYNHKVQLTIMPGQPQTTQVISIPFTAMKKQVNVIPTQP